MHHSGCAARGRRTRGRRTPRRPARRRSTMIPAAISPNVPWSAPRSSVTSARRRADEHRSRRPRRRRSATIPSGRPARRPARSGVAAQTEVPGPRARRVRGEDDRRADEDDALDSVADDVKVGESSSSSTPVAAATMPTSDRRVADRAPTKKPAGGVPGGPARRGAGPRAAPAGPGGGPRRSVRPSAAQSREGSSASERTVSHAGAAGRPRARSAPAGSPPARAPSTSPSSESPTCTASPAARTPASASAAHEHGAGRAWRAPTTADDTDAVDELARARRRLEPLRQRAVPVARHHQPQPALAQRSRSAGTASGKA